MRGWSYSERLTRHSRVRPSARSWTSVLYNPTIRGVVFQLALAVFLVAFFWWIVDNTITNLQARQHRLRASVS